MDGTGRRETGRRRLTAVTGVVGAGAVAIAALVGFTRPAPVHATGTTPDTGTSDTGTTVPGHRDRHDLRSDRQGLVPQGSGGPPDAGSSGS